MHDRLLLELAARAAGYVVRWHDDTLTHGPAFTIEDPENPYVFKIWNPLTDDGDALRLAVLLNLEIHSPKSNPTVMFRTAENDVFYQDACIRLAITRAAAEIGKSMGGVE
ncbi:hypothetical protein KUU31_11415 [Pseudomonas aeruginosa]|nr:hypothetical protein [Pseudomonas aeruginosa]